MSADRYSESIHRVNVLESFMSYRQAGTGSPTVFLHGNPTSSYVWRNVLPLVADKGRCLAPDLIGMGHSGKPESAYHFADHARYLDAWFAALHLRDVVLVGYDWGGVLAVDWAARHADRVRAVAVFETILQSMHWREFPPQGAELFRALRTPGVGETLVLEQNEFLARSLGNGVKRGLSESDRAEYYAPYLEASSRRPMLQWPRQIPIDGDPADVMAVITNNGQWLASTPEIPKLLLTFDGTGMSNAPAVVDWARRTIPNLDVVPMGAAGHHAPEVRATRDSWRHQCLACSVSVRQCDRVPTSPTARTSRGGRRALGTVFQGDGDHWLVVRSGPRAAGGTSLQG